MKNGSEHRTSAIDAIRSTASVHLAWILSAALVGIVAIFVRGYESLGAAVWAIVTLIVVGFVTWAVRAWRLLMKWHGN